MVLCAVRVCVRCMRGMKRSSYQVWAVNVECRFDSNYAARVLVRACAYACARTRARYVITYAYVYVYILIVHVIMTLSMITCTVHVISDILRRGSEGNGSAAWPPTNAPLPYH